ncbi:MAG: MmcQ/YjbR family DNA-binding protein [Flavobacteriales bacterium]
MQRIEPTPCALRSLRLMMDIQLFREYCLGKTGVSEHLPFDNRTLVFKVGSKMFALCDIEEFESANLKCDPERAVELREQFDGITSGYHMNKKHWNTVSTHGDVPIDLFLQLVDHSYELVKSSLPKKEREKL